MKHSLSIILSLAIIFSNAIASSASMEQAETAAILRLERDGMTDSHLITSCMPIQSQIFAGPVAYLFKLSPDGYVITSANTFLPPVIAYSYLNSSTTPEDTQSILIDLVKADMEQRLASITEIPQTIVNENVERWENNAGNALFEQWPPVGSTPTEGWIEENWTQSAPYNSYCPMDLIAGSRSIAGCPAVAMGMILNFNQTTNSTRFDNNDDYYHNYHEYYWIDDDYQAHDFPSWPELNGYLVSLDSLYANQLPLDELDEAALVFASGSACKQVYTASSSGTFGVTQAYDGYQRFAFTECELLDSTSDSLYERLSDNMISALPAHLAIIDAASQYGHNVVLDGYNTDEFFHMNFGWGGSYNGWYQFPLTGIPYSMNLIEGVVLDISPSTQSIQDDTSDPFSKPVSLSCSSNPSSGIFHFILNTDFACTVNLSVFTLSGRLLETVTHSDFAEGSHSISWVPEDESTGIYILRAESTNGTDAIKFTLVN